MATFDPKADKEARVSKVDEKPKDEITPPVTDTKKDVEYEGYKFTFDADIIDDVEIVEMVAEIESGKPEKIIVFLKLVLGEQTYLDMKNFFIAKDGKFRLTKMTNIFEEIFNKFDPKG